MMPRHFFVLLLSALLVLPAGCAVERSGLGIGDGGVPPTDGGVDARVELDGAPRDFGRGDLGADLGASTCDPLGCAGFRCDPLLDACSHHPSCLALRDDNRVAPLPNGIYEIRVDSARAPVNVYCDMSISGGGWTLVGRTAGNMDEPFGWTTARGLVDGDSQPYSLGLGSSLAFTEVLIGKRGIDKNWGDRSYRLTVPVDFIMLHTTSAYMTTDVTPIGRTCSPPPSGPAMLAYIGHTSATDHFFFRDSSGLDLYGMRAGEFSVNYTDCANGGELQGNEGMIMVR